MKTTQPDLDFTVMGGMTPKQFEFVGRALAVLEFEETHGGHAALLYIPDDVFKWMISWSLRMYSSMTEAERAEHFGPMETDRPEDMVLIPFFIANTFKWFQEDVNKTNQDPTTNP